MDLQKIREELLQKRSEIIESLSNNNSEDLNEKTGVDDAADIVASELSRETLYKLSQAERETLFLIDIALKKIENGTYGVCEECGAPIGEKRLQAIPWVRLCIECSQNEETIKSFSSRNEDISYYHIIPDTFQEEEENKNIPE
ncbi:MAG TPA: molecular chaperone DnaK [Persephonella sp.]|uniref:DnaK suppressor protein n=1 Tax=Persephonella marina (strain DSM 14350 / EX-H1) TaxID=123214 RepID=C0QRJ4_PERMH|nr:MULTISPECIES: TraR/DksA C4-type zinc finger protein [Persephonella]ACO03228.1 DnaK suppressor protein [Persephonella marina EX-H1]HCB69035.1 molecular chaperone DnaK [Persephonella sp.]